MINLVETLRQNVKLLKEGEDQKKKTYLALCISPTIAELDLEKLNSIKDLELQVPMLYKLSLSLAYTIGVLLANILQP